jgi:hypothetical protein
MYQRRLAKLLLHPSLFSLMLTILICLVIITVSIWPRTSDDTFLYQYLYGYSGAITALQKSTDIAHFAADFSVSPLMYNLLIFAAATLIALGAYIILQLISKIIVGSYDTWHAVHDSGSSIKSVEKEIGTRVVVRSLVLLLWTAYIFAFFSLMLPYCVFIAQAGSVKILDWGILQILASFVILLITIHVHVIFLRLLLLRPRVFGGELDILQAIYETDNHMR